MHSQRNHPAKALWHKQPTHMHGQALLPPSVLRKLNPHAAYQQPYPAEQHVPLLNCTWDDTIILDPIHPHQIHTALRAAGFNPPPHNAYAIPIGSLHGREAVWFTPSSPPSSAPKPSDFTRFDPSDYRTLRVSEESTRYFRNSHQHGNQPALFAHEPRVLVRGITASGEPWPLSIRYCSLINSAHDPSLPMPHRTR